MKERLKEKKLGITSLLGIVLFIISKLLGASILVALFLGFSIFILYYFSQLKKKNLGIIGGIIIFIIDIVLFILILIPVQGYNLKIKDFYKNRDNYMKIFLKDPKEKLKNLQITIFRRPQDKIIRLDKYKEGTKIKLKQGDKIYFVGTKNYKSFAVIYLWDGTILRLTPSTKISLDKVTKNLNNLPESKTFISIENGNLWFKVIRLIKGGDNMQIKIGKGQTLIIRGTAGLVSRQAKANTAYIIDYKHFIEVKVGNKSKMLNEKQGAEIKNNKLEIINNINKILNKIGLNKNLIKEFKQLDKQDIKKINQEIRNFIKNNFNINKIEKIKLRLFSIGSKKYSNILDKIKTYQYILGENNQITNLIKTNPNVAFIVGSLGDYKARTAYLYNQFKNNIKNSDIYKTYIVNLGIEKKATNIKEFAKNYLKNISQDVNGFNKELKNTLKSFLNNY